MGSTKIMAAEKWLLNPDHVITDDDHHHHQESSFHDIQNQQPLLLSLNHVSFICKSVKKSVKFYENVLGFVLIKRPSSFDFEGAWLFNHGIGIHLLESEGDEMIKNYGEKKKINPKDNHISFQCSNMELIMKKLGEMKIEFVTAKVSEGGVVVDQLFFHDPDDYMIEICNCQNLPVLPLVNPNSLSCPIRDHNSLIPNTTFHDYGGIKKTKGGRTDQMQQYCSWEVDQAMKMMENLVMDMMDLSF